MSHETNEQLIISEWRAMLATFKKIIETTPPVKEVLKPLTELQEAAQNSSILTGRQREAIYERCSNYLNGTYGKNLSKPIK